MAITGNSARRIAGLDALRGIAAMSVVLFHYTTRFGQTFGHPSAPTLSFDSGFRGVDLFFMISGFVIFMTLDQTSRASDFVVSRFSRLYPTFWVCVLITFAAVAIAGLPGKEVSPLELLANFTMLPQLLHAKPVDGTYWTLEIELFFYTIMLGLFRLGWLRRVHAVLIAWLGLRVLSVAAEASGMHVSYLLTHVLILPHISLFGAGMMIYCLHARRGNWWQSAGLLGLCIVVGVTTDPDASLFVPLTGAAVMLAMSRRDLLWLANPLLVFLGNISYPLYLLHENIGFVVLRFLYRHAVPPDAAIVLTIAVAIGLAAIVTHTVERPAMKFIRNRWRARRADGHDGG